MMKTILLLCCMVTVFAENYKANTPIHPGNAHFTPLKAPLTYPGEHLPRGNRTVFSMQYSSIGGLQIVALGENGQLWHTYQIVNKTAPGVDNKLELIWKPWAQLTKYCPSKQEPKRICRFDGDPVIGRNRDGRLEVFARFHENLDVWQMYQTDVDNPEAWSTPRESSCVDQDQDTGIWYCLSEGKPNNQSHKHYWIITNPVFPTSDLTILNDPRDGRLQLWYRNFEGHMYMVQQNVPGDSSSYSPPVLISGLLME